jgi:hypothetical protein
MRRLINLLLIVAIALSVVASFAYLELDLAELGSANSLKQMGSYVQRFLSPDLSAGYLKAIAHGSLETLAMSALGTLLAALFGIVLALPAAGRFGWPLQSAARLLLNGLRAIPELVWAALMVLAAGLGPNAGTLALALHTTGVLGRLFSATTRRGDSLAGRQSDSGVLLRHLAEPRPATARLLPVSLGKQHPHGQRAGFRRRWRPGADAVCQPESVPGSAGQHGDSGDAVAGVSGRLAECQSVGPVDIRQKLIMLQETLQPCEAVRLCKLHARATAADANGPECDRQ